jgi:hypothetical protein
VLYAILCVVIGWLIFSLGSSFSLSFKFLTFCVKIKYRTHIVCPLDRQIPSSANRFMPTKDKTNIICTDLRSKVQHNMSKALLLRNVGSLSTNYIELYHRR